jgi:hypothetical protein
MTTEERAQFIDKFLAEHCLKVASAKGAEYSRGETDCYSNFKRVGEATGLDPVKIAYIYLAKHLDAIASFIKQRPPTLSEPIEGRLGDACNYLLIIASLLEEEKQQEGKKEAR